MTAYLDNAATTKVSESALKAAVTAMTENYGNPSSLHRMGLNAELAVTKARKDIALAMGADPERIFFTSGATEANNTILNGIAATYGRRKSTIVASSIEHPSVEEVLRELEKKGYKVKRIPPRSDGRINFAEFASAVDNDTFLATCMLVNNETGAVNPVDDIFAAVKNKNPDCITHTDAVQGFLKLPLKVSALSCDLMTVSGHKVHAPKGIGAMYVGRNIRLAPCFYGGGQEKGMRSGTEAVPLISAFGEAAAEQQRNIETAYKNALMLNSTLRKALAPLDYITFNTDEKVSSPYIVNFSVKGIRSEIMLHFLESRNVYVSSGSACSKGKKSRVLSQMNMPDELADTALRVSFSKMSSWGEIEMLVSAIKEGYMTLQKTGR